MHVLMVSQFYPPVLGGQERHVRNLAHALAARGHEVEVATIASGDAGTTMDGPVRVHRLRASAQRLPGVYSEEERPHAPPLPDPALRSALGRLLVHERFDVAHAHDWTVNSLLGPARRTRTPVVLTQHDYSHVCATKRMMRGDNVCPGPEPMACMRCAAGHYGPVKGAGVVLANMAERRVRARHVDAFVPVSSAVAARTDLTGARHVEVIANFVPDDLLVDPADLEVPSADAPILFVGDLTRDKGVPVLFEAYRRLEAPPPLTLAGRVLPETPPERAPGVVVLGPVSPDTVRQLMRGCLALVLPSIVLDCCPTVVLEAMAAGRAVVGSSSGGIPDLVDDGVTGFVVPPGDAVTLADALARLISDRAEAAALGRRGLDKVRAYTASAVTGHVEGLYRELVSRSPDTSPGEQGAPRDDASRTEDRHARR